jgi:hypothetical protein
MMELLKLQLTAQQRRAAAQPGSGPLRAIDCDTKTTYVLIPEEVYNRARTLFADDEDAQSLRDMYPHVMEVFGRAGWDDPAMDVYDELDPRGTPVRFI